MKLIKSLTKTVGLLYLGGAIATAGISCMFCCSGGGDPDLYTIFTDAVCWPYVFVIIT